MNERRNDIEDSSAIGAMNCPVPHRDGERIGLAHGGGGRLSLELFERVFLPEFRNDILAEQTDGARVDLSEPRVAMTTDAYVVRPIVFPGGDIGSLAVHGTVNDLAVSGARPIALAAAFVLEEGLEVETLRAIARSMRAAADAAADGLRIVCGDTKVIERRGGEAPGLTIATTGIGAFEVNPLPSPRRIESGDAILVSGPVGDHGMAVMSVREGLEFESPIVSDSASLWRLARATADAAPVACMRDLTRGGLSSALNELARLRGVAVEIDEAAVPVREQVAAACEILGFDPLYVACEGRFVAFVREADAPRALEAMRAHPDGREAARIGRVLKGGRAGDVTVRTPYGAARPLDMLSGEQLPRIC